MMGKLVLKVRRMISSPLAWNKIVLILVGRFMLKSLLLFGDLIDSLFFFRYEKEKLVNPIFIVGHPRSGTTFLHRFLLKILPVYRGMRLWDMIVPSIFLRRILNPIKLFLDNLSKGKLYDPKIHSTSLLKEETDDVALFFRSFEGLFSWLYFGAFQSYPSLQKLKDDLLYVSDLPKTLNNLKCLHKKNLFESSEQKKRILSKSFSLILDIDQILNLFPDAKIILLLRDPLEVIPSSMSLTRNVLQNLYQFDKLSAETKQIYYRNLYSASILFYKSLHELMQKQVDNNKVVLVSYNMLKNKFSSAIISIFDFLGVAVLSDTKVVIEEQSKRQESYKSAHKYSLGEFGLSEHDIRKDFDFIYANYDV